MKERCQARTAGSEEEEPLDYSETPTDIYEALEKHAHDIGFCKNDLRQALLAVERDGVHGFKARKVDIIQNVRQRWEGLNNEEALREVGDKD